MNTHQSEIEILATIREALDANSTHSATADVIESIGDDAAVLAWPAGQKMVLCSDAMVEGQHFRLDWSRPNQIGHKAIASCLSDVAAMNAKPHSATVTLGLREGLPENFVRELYNGMGAVAQNFGLSIVGGDLVRTTSEIFIDIAIIGATSAPIYRRGASPGDLIVVSGDLGSSHGGLWSLKNSHRFKADSKNLLLKHLQPNPRLDLLGLIAEFNSVCARSIPGGLPAGVTSMIDLSDGLVSELHHLSEASKLPFEINLDLLPRHQDLRLLCEAQDLNINDFTLYGGEDYELLMTVNPHVWLELERVSPPGHLSGLSVIGQVLDANPSIDTSLQSSIVVAKTESEPAHMQLPRAGWDPFR